MSDYTPSDEDVESFARVLAAIESRKLGWGFTIDQAVAYRAEKWRRHAYEAEQLLRETHPWLAEHDAKVRAEEREKVALMVEQELEVTQPGWASRARLSRVAARIRNQEAGE